MKRARSVIPITLASLVILLAVLLWRNPAEPELPGSSPEDPGSSPPSAQEADPEPEASSPPRPPLSNLASPPNWSRLNAWQSTLSRSEFLSDLEEVFTVSPAWRDWIHLSDTDVLIETGVPDERFRLRFAEPGIAAPNPRRWRSAAELGPAPSGRPLEGLHIAIDPGHIGGRWAKIEERWFQVGQATPVKEGDMTLLVAKILRPRLEALGAKVSMVRRTSEPVTSYRPETLLTEAEAINPDSPARLAEILFYRTAEIRARAALVNDKLQPDLVLCLHFNAEAWGSPDKPTLVDGHHFHMLLNGAYTDSEIALADQRYQMVRKIVSRIHPEEAALAASAAAAFARVSDLPPFLYEPNSSRAVNVDGNPYLWARNLLANRIYDCPVLFFEPYVMNSVEDHARIQAGDFEGVRKVAGKARPSVFREYADAIVEGLTSYYEEHRPIEN